MPTNVNHDLISRLRDRKHAIVLISLALMAVLHPTFNELNIRYRWFDILFTVLLLASVFAMSRSRSRLVIALVAGVPALAFTWMVHQYADLETWEFSYLNLARLFFEMLFLGYISISIFSDVLKKESVTSDKICGGVSVYILLGIIWALLYSGLEMISPDAIIDNTLSGEQQGPLDFGRLMYFSFVTMTTLGYGDILPITPTARTFAWLQAVTGQLYLIVLLGRLVSLRQWYLPEDEDERAGESE